MSEAGGKRVAVMVASASIAIGLGLVLLLAVAARKEPKPEKSAQRPEEKRPQEPVRTGDRTPVDVEKTGEPPKSVEADLAAKKGEQARSQWATTKKLMEKTREDHLRALPFPPERVQSIRAILQAEEEVWLKDFESRIAPAFRGEGPPRYEFLQSAEYKAFVQGFTADSDRQIKLLLDDGQWRDFERWRNKFNRERYFTGVSR